jgi:hypothetical protein
MVPQFLASIQCILIQFLDEAEAVVGVGVEAEVGAVVEAEVEAGVEAEAGVEELGRFLRLGRS